MWCFVPESFQSTLPGWGATIGIRLQCFYKLDFNPRSPGGERREDGHVIIHVRGGFQSTLPGWGATGRSEGRCMIALFQSTLPGWGATPYGRALPRHDQISIHAPRVGSDTSKPTSRISTRHFNPRSPGGERLTTLTLVPASVVFQSTLPGWGATRADRRRPVAQDPISIHAPRMGSDLFRHPFFPSIYISIHAPRVGSDRSRSFWGSSQSAFQSTLPGWGATDASEASTARCSNFNPRSPGGERQADKPRKVWRERFQSTLPGWGATCRATTRQLQ